MCCGRKHTLKLFIFSHPVSRGCRAFLGWNRNERELWYQPNRRLMCFWAPIIPKRGNCFKDSNLEFLILPIDKEKCVGSVGYGPLKMSRSWSWLHYPRLAMQKLPAAVCCAVCTARCCPIPPTHSLMPVFAAPFWPDGPTAVASNLLHDVPKMLCKVLSCNI